MSTMTRPAKTKKNAQAAPLRAKMIKESEAPDRGVFSTETEAPDSGRIRRFEAPDAGEGRSSAIESEFTHGRSQS